MAKDNGDEIQFPTLPAALPPILLEEEEVEDIVVAATGVRNTWIPVPGSLNLENFSAILWQPISSETWDPGAIRVGNFLYYSTFLYWIG